MGSKRTEYSILALIIIIAVGFRLYNLATVPTGIFAGEVADSIARLQSISVDIFGHTVLALRIISALAGVLTVLGTYLLSRRLFNNWEIAAIGAFLMATGMWHVSVSRIGGTAIFAPLCAVWGLYYLYQGLLTTRIWPWLMSGVWLGLGMYAGTDSRLIPAVALVAIVGYLFAIRKEFSHDKFAHIRQQVIGGMSLMISILVIFFISDPSGTIADSRPLLDTGTLAGDLELFNVLIGALLVVGILRTIYKIFRTWRTHGHPSIVHLLLVSWLAVGLFTDSLFVTAPALYIIAGQGVWWLYVWFKHWYSQRDVHQVCLPGPKGHQHCVGEGALVVGFTLVVFLFAMGTLEANRYFVEWAQAPTVLAQTDHISYEIADQLNALPPATLKYVVIVNSASNIMYLTDTMTIETQELHNIYYLTQKEFDQHAYPKGAHVIQQSQ